MIIIQTEPTPPPEVVERRESRRSSVVLAVTVASKSNFYMGITENLSEGGVFVAMENPLPVGSEIDLTIELADGLPPLTLKGEVRWQRECPPRGAGVQFREMTAGDRGRIRSFMRRRAPLFFDE